MVLIFLFLCYHKTIRVFVLLEFQTMSSCWSWYGTNISFFLSPNYQSRGVIRILNNIKLLDLVLYWNFILCHPTIRVTVLLDFETISSCWTWCCNGFFCIFNLTEQWEQPRYHTLKQYQVAGIGMVLIFLFLFCHQIIRFAVLLEFQTISSCWTWYYTDIFPFLSPHYQSQRVIGFGNNIKLLNLVLHWFFLYF